MTETRNGSWQKYLLGIVATLSGVGVMGNVLMYREIGENAADSQELFRRMQRMESGETTPMSMITLERFNAFNQRVNHIEEELITLGNRLDRLIDSFHATEGVKREKLRKSGLLITPNDPLPPWKPASPTFKPGVTGG